MKYNVKELLKIANNQYNFEIVIRHNKRLEKALKQILKRVESGNLYLYLNDIIYVELVRL